ncbi:MAG: 1,4-dihydroxy-2-naphthoate octaprenyltransferase [Cognaticolwellia sp.]|jgi:1,4-dihydroxy-2-naphthoate octaprenyltransferase
MAIFFSALVCAMSLQMAVNLANDLFDSLSGMDNEQRVGPVRVVQAGLISLLAIKLGLALTCTVAMLSGLGSYYLQTCTLSLLTFGLATSAGLYSSAIMLVNNIRDIATDQAVKNTPWRLF